MAETTRRRHSFDAPMANGDATDSGEGSYSFYEGAWTKWRGPTLKNSTVARPAARAMARRQPVVADSRASDGTEGKRHAQKVYRSMGKLTERFTGPKKQQRGSSTVRCGGRPPAPRKTARARQIRPRGEGIRTEISWRGSDDPSLRFSRLELEGACRWRVGFGRRPVRTCVLCACFPTAREKEQRERYSRGRGGDKDTAPSWFLATWPGHRSQQGRRRIAL